jgi:peroxiredoxin
MAREKKNWKIIVTVRSNCVVVCRFTQKNICTAEDIHNVTNMTIAGQRFGKHVPAATNKRGINTRCYEGRSLQINLVQDAFP